MDFDVIPGPSLPERARTALARAATATMGTAASVRVPVRAGPGGSPVLLAAAGSLLERRLADSRAAVTVTVPAGPKFRALRLTGAPCPTTRDPAVGLTAYTVEPTAVELTGPRGAFVPVSDYRAAAPDPLWRIAPKILHHLEHGHMAELIRCVRVHGLTAADWVIPRDLDRYGLELAVLTPDGAAAARLAFPDGPITSLHDVPASIRVALTCRCHDGNHRHRHPEP